MAGSMSSAGLRCATVREVNSESRFLDWVAQASARIEAVSDAERALLFRERWRRRRCENSRRKCRADSGCGAALEHERKRPATGGPQLRRQTQAARFR